jgi:hypothetical protein
MKFSTDININDFIKNFNRTQEDVLQVFRLSLMDVGLDAQKDVDEQTPIDTGNLTGSGNVAVTGLPIDKRKKSSKQLPLFLDGLNENKNTKIMFRLSYNMEYAKDVHDNYDKMIPGEKSADKFGIPREIQPEPAEWGHLYLQKTMDKNKNKYMKNLAHRIKTRMSKL